MQTVIDGCLYRKRGESKAAYCLAVPLRRFLPSKSSSLYRINATSRLLEKHCARCHAWYPADSRFFDRLSWERHHSYCRRCVQERTLELRAMRSELEVGNEAVSR